jgi:glycine oxidase
MTWAAAGAPLAIGGGADDAAAVADLSTDIVIIGAGVLGLSVAAELAACGRQLLVVDPGGANASSVAAGMIAPAFESLLDGADTERAAVLREAAALWPDFAARHGLEIDPTPAEWRGPDPAGVAEALIQLGFRAERRAGAVVALDDVRIEPDGALARLADRVGAAVASGRASALVRTDTGWAVVTSAGTVRAAAVVLATGVGSPLPGLPEAAARVIGMVRPIAGQIGRVDMPLSDRVLRGSGGYVVPTKGGALIGATMVEGQAEAVVDARASARLIAEAEALIGRVIDAPVDWRAAVRGATPDGLPLAGVVGEGLHLALAPRRNGWLMGPLVARIVAEGIEGRPRGAHAAALDPLRFNPQAG